MSVKITDLNNAGVLDGSEIVPIVQAGETVQTTAQDVANLCDLSSICVKAGDTLTFGSRDFIASGEFTGSSKVLAFVIPINKIITATGISSISGTIICRGINGYLVGNNGFSLTDTSIVSSVNTAITPSGVKVVVNFVSAPSGASNNTPVNVSINTGSVSITFS